MPQIVWTARPDGNIDYLNRRWTEFTGLPETVGQRRLGADPAPRRRPARRRALGGVARERRPVRDGDPAPGPAAAGATAGISSGPWPSRTRRGRSPAGSARAPTSTSRSGPRSPSRFLAEASAALAGVVDYESTLQKVANLAVPYFADWSAVDLANDDGDAAAAGRRPRGPGQGRPGPRVACAATRPTRKRRRGLSPSSARASRRSSREITDDLLVQGAKDERPPAPDPVAGPEVLHLRAAGRLRASRSASSRSSPPSRAAVHRRRPRPGEDLAHRAAVAIENAQLYQALREADRRKDEFLATLAHELRNPLAPIRNALQILQDAEGRCGDGRAVTGR